MMSKSNLIIFSLLFCGLLLRIFLTPYLSYRQDVYTYIYWSESLVKNGPKAFFMDNWVDYLPGYPYILWLLAAIKSTLKISADTQLMLLYKLPAIIADILTGLLIYKLIDKSKKISVFHHQFSLRTLAAATFVFNPAIFANSALWGQTDAFTGLASLGALYLVTISQPLLAGAVLGLGTLIKLNTILIAPVLAIIVMRQKQPLTKMLTLSIVSVAVFVLGFVPFQNQPNITQFIASRINITTNQYQHTSLNAFNFWFLLDGSWKSDQDLILGLTKHTWGNILFLSVSIVALLVFLVKSHRYSHRNTIPLTYDAVISAAIIFSAAFLLLTRMHERHFFAALPFLLIAASVSVRWCGIYLWYSCSYIANLVFGYQQAPTNPTLIPLPATITTLISTINVATLGYMTGINPGIFSHFKLPRLPQHQPTALIIILTLALGIRLVRLGTPAVYHFDEVYHAFTAREMLQGNVKAWEWWNTSPPGVAYEWTHPPLSKHFMVLGMQILGNNVWGWRTPGVLFSVANIYLVYLIAKILFPPNHQLPATSYQLPLIAAGLYSVESLTFVQSRIGMNDTYMIFFVLFSLYALLNRKLPASMLGFGLAIATKWSAIYIAPLLGLIIIARFRHNLKMIPVLATSYLLLATGVYLLVYTPFFASGHTWKQFMELQQQMFWYHTRLNATHDYSSPAWSWPILLRPVWYYVQYGNNTIANIYALGNPIIFWGGLVSVLVTLVVLAKNLVKRSLSIIHYPLSICLIGYLVFFMPWIFSPRIMFLYHYLPSIPFLTIILAWTISQLYNFSPKGRIIAVSYISLAIYTFIFFYPHLTALPVPLNLSNLFYWLPGWK